jgi:putative transferase (TIGR04331 family)
LVTTALEQTWPSSLEPVLFLGEWCKRFTRKFYWDTFKHETAPYHWEDRIKFSEDCILLEGIYEEMLIEVSASLNEIHGVKYSTEYWRILVGPWLSYFVQIIFDRWFVISSAINAYNFSKVRVLHHNDVELIPQDMDEFTRFLSTDVWNEMVYSKILKNFDIPIDTVNTPIIDPGVISVANKPSQLKKIKNNLLCVIGNSYKKGFSSDYFIYKSSFLPIEKFFLELSLGQFPSFRAVPILEIIEANFSMRSWGSIKSKKSDSFWNLLRVMIPLQIPVVYLEGYTQLTSTLDNCRWPLTPKVILTKSAHISDEIFKIFLARSMISGAKLMIQQHGGGYGLMKWFSNENHEKKISSLFLTWGWNDNSSKIFPIGALNSRYKNIFPFYGVKKLLLVQQTLPRYSYKLASEPNGSLFNIYIKEQFEFFDSLPFEISNKTVVRLYPNEYGWDQKERWLDHSSTISIDKGRIDFLKLACRYSLIVITYNGTSLLECLLRGHPTIVFWNPSHYELRKNADPYFDLLKKVGIFHVSPSSAALKITEIWDDIGGWWHREDVQAARNLFIDHYAKQQHQPIQVVCRKMRELNKH